MWYYNCFLGLVTGKLRKDLVIKVVFLFASYRKRVDLLKENKVGYFESTKPRN